MQSSLLMAHSDWNKTYHVDEMTLSPYSSIKDLLINTPGVGRQSIHRQEISFI